MKKLAQEQKKFIYIASTVAFLLLIFWIFIYLPQSRRLSSIKERLNGVEAQIAQINRIIEGRDLREIMEGLNNQLKGIYGKLPPRFDDVVDDLSEDARKLNIEVKNINFLNKELLKDVIPGYEIEKLPVVMNLVCEYNALGDYLDVLRTKFPVVLRAKQLDIKGKGEGQPRLDVDLQILAYLAREISTK